jgi:hypothetical protein
MGGGGLARAGWRSDQGGPGGRGGQMQRGGAGGGGGDFAGMGPRDFQRSPDLIGDEVVLVLTADPDVDATDITVIVGDDGVVTLIGTVEDRDQAGRAEGLAGSIPGVTDVRNQLDVGAGAGAGAGDTGGRSGATGRQGQDRGAASGAGAGGGRGGAFAGR